MHWKCHVFTWKAQWYIQGNSNEIYIECTGEAWWNSQWKCTGYLMKYPMKAHQIDNEREWECRLSQMKTMKLTTPMRYERNSWHYENEKLPALYEIFHKKHWHFTHSSAGNCLSFIIKVVATSHHLQRRPTPVGPKKDNWWGWGRRGWYWIPSCTYVLGFLLFRGSENQQLLKCLICQNIEMIVIITKEQMNLKNISRTDKRQPAPQTRDNWAVKQSVWQIPWQMNHFCNFYVIRPDAWDKFYFVSIFANCSKGLPE